MGLKGNNFHHANVVGLALAPQSLNNGAGTGVTISEPWSIGRQISFILAGGAFAASSVGACAVQGLKRSDGTTWEALTESDGTTALVFTAAKLADAGALEGSVVLGTIPLQELDGTTYKAIRIVYTESGSAAQLVSAVYVISDVYSQKTSQADDLFSKVRP